MDWRLMQLRVKHNLGFIPLLAEYALTEVCKAAEDRFCDRLNSIFHQTRLLFWIISMPLLVLAEPAMSIC